jgi:hypothetical protein
VDEVQSFGVGQSPCVSGGKPPTFPYLRGQYRIWRNIEHDSSCILGTPVCNAAPGKITLHEVSKIAVEIGKSVREVLSEALEHLPYVLVEPRLNYLRSSVILLLVCISSLRDLIPQCGNLSRHLVERARPTVDVPKVTFEFDG